jgi:hypothetical protein
VAGHDLDRCAFLRALLCHGDLCFHQRQELDPSSGDHVGFRDVHGSVSADPVRYSRLTSYSGSTGDSLLGKTITLTTIGGALPAQDVYFRVGARINAGLDEYNYNSPVSINYP